MRTACRPGWRSLQEEATPAPKKAKTKGDDAPAEGVNIFIKNLPWKCSEDDLAEFFADCGEVTSARISEFSALKPRAAERAPWPSEHILKLSTHVGTLTAVMGDDGRSKGFGYVDFATPVAAEKALKKSGEDFLGRSIVVDTTTPRRNSNGDRTPRQQQQGALPLRDGHLPAQDTSTSRLLDLLPTARRHKHSPACACR